MARSLLGVLVLFSFKNGRDELVTRPARVVREWTPGYVNLKVDTDFGNDFPSGPGSDGSMWATSVSPSESGGPELGRYHFDADALGKLEDLAPVPTPAPDAPAPAPAAAPAESLADLVPPAPVEPPKETEAAPASSAPASSGTLE